MAILSSLRPSRPTKSLADVAYMPPGAPVGQSGPQKNLRKLLIGQDGGGGLERLGTIGGTAKEPGLAEEAYARIGNLPLGVQGSLAVVGALTGMPLGMVATGVNSALNVDYMNQAFDEFGVTRPGAWDQAGALISPEYAQEQTLGLFDNDAQNYNALLGGTPFGNFGEGYDWRQEAAAQAAAEAVQTARDKQAGVARFDAYGKDRDAPGYISSSGFGGGNDDRMSSQDTIDSYDRAASSGSAA